MTHRPRGPRPAILFYGLAAVLTALSLAGLYQLQIRFADDLETGVASLQRVLADESILRTPGDPMVKLGELDAMASKYEGTGYFKALAITKYFGDSERTVYPWYYPAVEPTGAATLERPDPRGPSAPSDRILPLAAGGVALGRLYLRLDETPLRTVRAVTASLAVLLIAALVLLALQFRRQEAVISRTTVELDEKRREMVRLERLALAGQLSAGIIHDIRKPMLNIRNEIADAGETGVLGQRIREQTDLFFSILRDTNLERFVRGEGDLEFVDINDLMERSLALVHYEQGAAALGKDLAHALPAVLAPPVRIIQVFSNIILNAYQAVGGSGTVAVRTYAGPAGTVVAEISDSGPGIPPHHMERVFTPFFTTKPDAQGTGLGLYIARDIVQELGGTLTVESQPGRTTFTISFPAAA